MAGARGRGAAGSGQQFAEAIPAIIAGARATVAHRRDEPGDDLVSELIRVQSDESDRLTDAELVTLVWHLVLAGQTPTNLIANAVEALLTHPAQPDRLRTDGDEQLMTGAVEELTRWCGPQLLTIPRFAREDVTIDGVRIRQGEAVVAALVSANQDPRVFADPDRLDVSRPPGPSGHLGYGHGPHFCLGAALARTQTEVALTALLRRFPSLALVEDGVQRPPDPGTWRLAAVPVTL